MLFSSIVNKVVNRDPSSRIPVIIDTENYRHRTGGETDQYCPAPGGEGERGSE